MRDPEFEMQYANNLLEKATPNGECLECHLSDISKGYCKVIDNESAHRFIHRVKKGPVAGLVVRHTCDNRKCINPTHLIAGTSLENNQDCINKGRAVLDGRPRYLADKERAKIIEMRERKLTLQYIASEYGVSIGTIRRMIMGHD